MAVIVSSDGKRGLTIVAHCRNKPNNRKLALYYLLLLTLIIKELLYNIVTRQSTLVIQVGVG